MRRVPDSPALPIRLVARSAQAVYRQLYEWFQKAIVTGQLSAGQRLPSSRDLAGQLGVSRITVLQAFEQLKAEGYVQATIGAGTRVASVLAQEVVGHSYGGAKPTIQRRGIRRIAQPTIASESLEREPWLRIEGAFRPHVPALDHFPIEIWSRLVARHARRSTNDLMMYGDPMGYQPFRESIAQYLRTVRGVRCESRQVMVVCGSQQALSLCTRVLIDAGKTVWVEEPGYPGAHQAFEGGRARMVAVPVDAEGIDVTAGIRLSRMARAAYVTPSHQYPLGPTLSVARRLQLLDWASRSGAWILEDDYDSEYRQGIRPIAALQGLDSDSRVLYIGTFSKALFPALRVGYLIVPTDLVGAFSAARDAADMFPSALFQSVLTDFIEEGHFARHVRRMRILYAERCNVLVNALNAQLSGVVEIANGEAGMQLVALLPHGLDDVIISRKLAAAGISAMPLSSCCIKPPARTGLILGYGMADEAQIRIGVRKFRACLEAVLGERAFRELRTSNRVST